MNERYKLKKGDKVVMHTCLEHDNPDHFGKIWTCSSDQFTRGKGVYAQDSVFLEGYSGSFAPEFLQKVNVDEVLEEAQGDIEILKFNGDSFSEMLSEAHREIVRLCKGLEEKDTTIEMLTKQITDEVAISAAAIVERDRLRKQLEDKKNLLRMTDQSRDEARRMYKEACDEANELQQQLAEKEAEIQQLRKALKFYSVNSHYECSHTYDETGEAEVVPSKVGRDRGSLARKALGE
ncbi:hypothetical protein [Paenibacillus medicaginis]|uniref:Uncharacterized protein n=1 Tax=Paenibacillus medicaginis TaxID=1470560 RepID=A0ABV5C0K3_9BACL